MTGCDNAVEYVYQFIDDELTVARRARIKWHLKRCGVCVGAFDFERQLKARIAAAGRAEPPAEFLQQIRAIVEQEDQRSGDC
jgi:mycothiol system anti-sigma-R factor